MHATRAMMNIEAEYSESMTVIEEVGRIAVVHEDLSDGAGVLPLPILSSSRHETCRSKEDVGTVAQWIGEVLGERRYHGCVEREVRVTEGDDDRRVDVLRSGWSKISIHKSDRRTRAEIVGDVQVTEL